MTKPFHFLPYSSFLAKIFKPLIEGRGEGRVELCRPVTNSRFRISKTDFQPFEKVSLSNEKKLEIQQTIETSLCASIGCQSVKIAESTLILKFFMTPPAATEP